MAVKKQDIEIWKKNHNVVRFTVENREDLSDVKKIEWAMTRRKRPPRLIEKSSEESGEITTEGNQILVLITPQDTADLTTLEKYWHEAKVIDFNDEEITIAEGLVTLHWSMFAE